MLNSRVWSALRAAVRRYGPAVAVEVVAAQFGITGIAKSALHQSVKMFVGYMDRPGRRAAKRPRTEYSADPSSYQQISYARSKTGKNRYSAGKLLAANVARQDFWFKGLKSFDDNGFYWMDKYESAGIQQAPCYIFAPFHINNQGVFSNPFRRMAMVSGQWRSNVVNGQNVNGVSNSAMNTATDQNMLTTTSFTKGMLRWTSFKFNLWGCINKATRYTISFVKPVVDDANPWDYSTGTTLPETLQEELNEYLRPKIVNPIATANDMHKSAWKILKTYVYDLDPTIQGGGPGGEGDPDPHVKRVEIFNRWDRIVDFKTTVNTPVITNADFNNPTNGLVEAVDSSLRVRPSSDKDVFLIISASNYTPYAEEAPTNSADPSFDMSFRSSWSRL